MVPVLFVVAISLEVVVWLVFAVFARDDLFSVCRPPCMYLYLHTDTYQYTLIVSCRA